MRIAFGCKSRVGKDTAANYLHLVYQDSAVLSFASPLKNILSYAQEVCDFPQIKDRVFLQWVGTEWARSRQDDVWIRLMRKNIRECTSTHIFVSDLRFKNEFLALKEMGFVLVKIERPEMSPEIFLNKSHQSECDLDDIPDEGWDYVIQNDSTKEIFYDHISHIATEINHHQFNQFTGRLSDQFFE